MKSVKTMLAEAIKKAEDRDLIYFTREDKSIVCGYGLGYADIRKIFLSSNFTRETTVHKYIDTWVELGWVKTYRTLSGNVVYFFIPTDPDAKLALIMAHEERLAEQNIVNDVFIGLEVEA